MAKGVFSKGSVSGQYTSRLKLHRCLGCAHRKFELADPVDRNCVHIAVLVMVGSDGIANARDRSAGSVTGSRRLSGRDATVDVGPCLVGRKPDAERDADGKYYYSLICKLSRRKPLRQRRHEQVGCGRVHRFEFWSEGEYLENCELGRQVRL